MKIRFAAILALLVVASAPFVPFQAASAQESRAEEPPPAAAFDQAQALQALRASIAGREEEPAGKVFRNVELLREVPAGRLLRVMEIGYARSLGVTCVHCHTTEDWSSDAKREKRAARQMITFTRDLNQRLAAVPELQAEKPTVNCTTCHRGQVVPALDLD